MVSRNQKHAAWRGHRSENRCVYLEILRPFIDDVSGHGDQVRIHRRDLAGDSLETLPGQVRADVQIGELDDTKAIELRWKVGQFGDELADDERACSQIPDCDEDAEGDGNDEGSDSPPGQR